MLQPNANPPYDEFVNRIVAHSDQQASVFLQVSVTAVRIKLDADTDHDLLTAKDEGRLFS